VLVESVLLCAELLKRRHWRFPNRLQKAIFQGRGTKYTCPFCSKVRANLSCLSILKSFAPLDEVNLELILFLFHRRGAGQYSTCD